MSGYRKIFVVADGHRPCSAAVRRGAQLALQSDAELTIGLFEHDAAVERAAHRGAGPREAYIVERRQWLEDRVAPFLDPAIRLRLEAVWAPARRDAILAAVLADKPDLVLKDIGHESALRRLVATPLDWELLRSLPAALMLVQPSSTQLPRRVLAAVDTRVDTVPHPLNERVLQAARRIAACGNARVDLVHAFPHEAGHGVLSGHQVKLELADRDAFHDFAGEYVVPLERRHWVAGSPQQAIERVAGLVRADLLVLGSAYRSALERISLGTTVETLLQHCTQDVLLIKPEDFAEELGRHLDLADLQRRHLAAA
jgi:universal stress protein E